MYTNMLVMPILLKALSLFPTTLFSDHLLELNNTKSREGTQMSATEARESGISDRRIAE